MFKNKKTIKQVTTTVIMTLALSASVLSSSIGNYIGSYFTANTYDATIEAQNAAIKTQDSEIINLQDTINSNLSTIKTQDELIYTQEIILNNYENAAKTDTKNYTLLNNKLDENVEAINTLYNSNLGSILNISYSIINLKNYLTEISLNIDSINELNDEELNSLKGKVDTMGDNILGLETNINTIEGMYNDNLIANSTVYEIISGINSQKTIINSLKTDYETVLESYGILSEDAKNANQKLDDLQTIVDGY